jgi:lysophospholipid acyltransferase (LPLAT)-like uncharacterized protein
LSEKVKAMEIGATTATSKVKSAASIVKPHRLKWHQRVAASLIYCLIQTVAWTLRYRWEYAPEVLEKHNGPVIFCIWHNRLPLSLIMYGHYARQKQQPHRMAAIVSASKDGGVVARILEHFGVQPVRGSSSRRGPQALLELTSWAERGYDLAITPDGPRGPRYVIQPGAVALAQLTGQPLVPVSYHLSWKICLKSWDLFQIPLPFSRTIMKFGQPVRIPREIPEEQRELFRQELEKRLLELTVD